MAPSMLRTLAVSAPRPRLRAGALGLGGMLAGGRLPGAELWLFLLPKHLCGR